MNKISFVSMSFLLMLGSTVVFAGDEKVAETEQVDQVMKDAKNKAVSDSLDDFGFVTLVKKDATITDVIDELKRKATWINIDLDMKGINENERISVDLQEPVPFRTALSLIVQKAGLVIEEDTSVLIRLSKPPVVSIKLKNAPIQEVIEIITNISGRNVIVSPAVTGSVTMNVQNVPWTILLDSAVKSVNAVIVKEDGGLLRIIPIAALQSQLERRVFRLKFLQPPASFKANIKTAYAVGATKATGDRISEFTMLNILRSALSASGRLDYDLESNAVIVTDTKPSLDKISDIIKKLDVEPDQVYIDVTFVSTSNEDLLNFGTNYTFSATGENGIGAKTDPLPFDRTSPLPFGLGQEQLNVHQKFLTDFSVQAIFRAFKKDQFTKIMQRPTIPVLNNNEATIFVGETIHYAEVATTTDVGGATIKTVQEASTSPVNVGFQLMVIPHVVHGTNTVILTVIPSNKFLVGKTSTTVPGFNRFTLGTDSIDLPQYNQTTVVTKLMIESGKTAVLGGLAVDRKTFTENKIPLLGDIPLISPLFKDTSESTIKDTLLIFVTPRIVRAGKTTSDNLEKVLRNRLKAEQSKVRDLEVEKFEKDVEKAMEKRTNKMNDDLQNTESK